MELVIFPKILLRYSSTLNTEDPVVVVGQVSIREDEAPKAPMRSIKTLVDATEDAKRQTKAEVSPLHVETNSPANTATLRLNMKTKKNYRGASFACACKR